MKSSKYNLLVDDSETGRSILFNTLYGSAVIVESQEKPIVTKLLEIPELTNSQNEIEILSLLETCRYLIKDDEDEISILRNRKVSGMNDINRADIIIMPNMNCNFCCPYCYEKHDSKKRMSKETEVSIKKWLKCEIPRHKVVLISWFGGEPLLSKDNVMSIGEYALKVCRENGVHLQTHMTTNGYAFTKPLIQDFVNIELLSYQITMDGTPEMHNKTRMHKGGKDSFERIFKNIILLCEADKRVKVSLRVNFNHTNIDSIPELLALFPAKVRQQLRVVYEPIFGDKTLSAVHNLPKNEISQKITQYYELANSMGYDVVHGGLGVGKLEYCYAEREHQYLINYNADVYKCSVSEFISQDRVGHINGGGELVRDQKAWDRWFDMELFEKKCEQCVYLPICMGGCRSNRIKNTETGDCCSLVPTNTSLALKAVAFGGFRELLSNRFKTSRV